MRTRLVSHTPHCNEHGECTRDEKHDAYFCASCNEWAEKRCSDSECEFCAHRPELPSGVKL